MAADVMIIVGIEEVRVDEEEVHGEVVELYLHHHLRLRGSGPRSSNPYTELLQLAVCIGILPLPGHLALAIGPSYPNDPNSPAMAPQHISELALNPNFASKIRSEKMIRAGYWGYAVLYCHDRSPYFTPPPPKKKRDAAFESHGGR